MVVSDLLSLQEKKLVQEIFIEIRFKRAILK